MLKITVNISHKESDADYTRTQEVSFPDDEKGQNKALKFLNGLAATHTKKDITEPYTEFVCDKGWVKRRRYIGKEKLSVLIEHLYPELL